MHNKRFIYLFVFTAALSSLLVLWTAAAFASEAALKKGMKGSEVTALQKNLQSLGYLSAEPTGLYGDLTIEAVKRFQAKNGLTADGIAGPSTRALINSQASGFKTGTSRSAVKNTNPLLAWYGGVDKLFSKGRIVTVYDIETGLSFKAKRTYGYNHADCETLTAKDTAIMKKIFGGQWSWERRAVVLTLDGRKIAGSMSGMPHAGLDERPANALVSSRSAGYGRGFNLDTVKNNGMNGHFDIHFLGSKTHGTRKVDARHQQMVRKAADWLRTNK